mmetsp:Transcript_51760/g.123178  ORF Transcript_51760/g.123178 Transcript_51760/m.123178 type:complete len:200 (-) Transcript_51760:595-1194(-)
MVGRTVGAAADMVCGLWNIRCCHMAGLLDAILRWVVANHAGFEVKLWPLVGLPRCRWLRLPRPPARSGHCCNGLVGCRLGNLLNDGSMSLETIVLKGIHLRGIGGFQPSPETLGAAFFGGFMATAPAGGGLNSVAAFFGELASLLAAAGVAMRAQAAGSGLVGAVFGGPIGASEIAGDMQAAVCPLAFITVFTGDVEAS